MPVSTIAPQPLTIRVQEVMSRHVPHALLEDPLGQVAQHTADLRVGWLVVVDSHNRVRGVVSQRELLTLLLATTSEGFGRQAVREKPVSSIISQGDPLTIGQEASVAEALAMVTAHSLECLPVVDRQEELKGLLTLSDLLRPLTQQETAGLETGFEFFQPANGGQRARPAFIRRANKQLVVPLDRLLQEHDLAERVMLGFDSTSGRVLVKFVPAGMKSSNSLPARTQADNLVIEAEPFVQHYRLLERSTTFDVRVPDDTRYLVLVPR